MGDSEAGINKQMAQTGNREEVRQSGKADIRNYLLVLNLGRSDCPDTQISSVLYLISAGRLTSADHGVMSSLCHHHGGIIVSSLCHDVTHPDVVR